MIKLKNILAEGFAWERKEDGSLPTLADTTAAYEAKMREQAELNMPYDDESTDNDVEESAKPDYIDADGDGDETESMKQAFKDKEEMKEGDGSSFSEYSDDALRDMKINLSRFEGNEEDIKDINAELKRRKNKKNDVNESLLITKGGLQEMREIPLEQRILRNLKGNDYILREEFRIHEQTRTQPTVDRTPKSVRDIRQSVQNLLPPKKTINLYLDLANKKIWDSGEILETGYGKYKNIRLNNNYIVSDIDTTKNGNLAILWDPSKPNQLTTYRSTNSSFKTKLPSIVYNTEMQRYYKQIHDNPKNYSDGGLFDKNKK